MRTKAVPRVAARQAVLPATSLWACLLKAYKKRCSSLASLQKRTRHPWRLIQCYNCRPQTDSFRFNGAIKLWPPSHYYNSNQQAHSSCSSCSSSSSSSSLDCETGTSSLSCGVDEEDNLANPSMQTRNYNPSYASVDSFRISGAMKLWPPSHADCHSHPPHSSSSSSLDCETGSSSLSCGVDEDDLANLLMEAENDDPSSSYAAVVKYSECPYFDFVNSMAEIILAKVDMIWKESELRLLLHSYLSLNHASHHSVIKLAFHQILTSLVNMLEVLQKESNGTALAEKLS